MDAREYDRIADLLMQIRKKVRKIEYKTKMGQWTIDQYCNHIDDLLHFTDILASKDMKELL